MSSPAACPVADWRIDVTVTPNEAARRVDVSIGGRPFTSYIWPERLKKPVLYPLQSASGTLVTRGWPLDPRPGERVDHPHQVGLWFVYGDVNGVDFWNNSEALTPEEQAKMGTIVHRKIVERARRRRQRHARRRHGLDRPRQRHLPARARDVRVPWRCHQPDRRTHGDAHGGRSTRGVQRQQGRPLRHARRAPARTAVDDAGHVHRCERQATTVKVLDNTGITGSYTSSEGKTGDAVWGTADEWTMLTGQIGTDAVTLAILDHPKNFGFPTHWHARGYGLFAANPLGQAVFSNGKETLNFTLAPGASATFKWRLAILSRAYGAAEIEALGKELAAGR